MRGSLMPMIRWVCLPWLVLTGAALRTRGFSVAGLQQRSRQVGTSLFAAATPQPISLDGIATRYDGVGQFDRWKFLQALLEAEAKPSMTNDLLFLVLVGTVNNPPTMDLPGIPQITDEIKSIVGELFGEGCFDVDRADLEILGIVDDSLTVRDERTFELLEQLLPSESEDPDAFKSLWDLVQQLHGLEMVKINQRNPTEEWKSVCLVARVLIHYDYLTVGIPQLARS